MGSFEDSGGQCTCEKGGYSISPGLAFEANLNWLLSDCLVTFPLLLNVRVVTCKIMRGQTCRAGRRFVLWLLLLLVQCPDSPQ